MSEQHREALAHLMYGFSSDGGFVLLTGEVGTGKTTICRCLLEQIPEKTSIAFILNPKVTVKEMLATVCDEFGIKYTKRTNSIKVFVDMINRYLIHAHARGRKAVLIIDEAQNLSADVLEQLRLLTNLETSQHKLLQIILLGQPELRDKLTTPELRQLSQRIIARYHLGPLSANDVSAYVKHRVSVAGLQKQLFPDPVIKNLSDLSGGIPRLINVICDRALLGTFTKGESVVSKATLRTAAREILGPDTGHLRQKKTYAWAMIILVFVIVGVVLAAARNNNVPQNSNPVSMPVLTGDLKWPETEPLSGSLNAAFQALFRQWGNDNIPADITDLCAYAETTGLRCEQKQGSMRSLLLLNRPAVLKLFDGRGQAYYVALTSVNGETATVVIGNEIRTVYVRDIESQWLGDYTLLWNTPPGFEGDIKPGDHSPLVLWIDKQMAVINNRPARTGTDPMLYDEGLASEVKQFQLAGGLVPDGIIGIRTLLGINSAVPVNTPTLNGAQETE
ncbi:MAG: AAA family ATPase [Nitrospirota bacterium]|nr:AAA family ATPase [Nitrospirota bacterium]